MAPPKSVAAQHKGKLDKDDPSLLPSDDDDDSDFHLSDAGDGSDSGDDSDDDDADGPAAKRQKLEQETKPALDKAAVDDLWAAFNDPSAQDPYAAPAPTTTTTAAAASTSSSSSNAAPKKTPVASDPKGKGKGKGADDDDLVEIEVEYGFAGEKIKQKKLVARSSVEAQAYLASRPPASSSSSAAPSAARAAPPAPTENNPPTTSTSLDALFGPSPPDPAPAPSPSAAAPAPAPEEKPAPAAPPRRRAGGGLAGMAASLGVGKKPAKLNTLEKSKLDWDSYVQTQEGLSDTLTHARKDGYLDRRDFLDRVEDNKERRWDEARGGAGRRR